MTGFGSPNPGTSIPPCSTYASLALSNIIDRVVGGHVFGLGS